MKFKKIIKEENNSIELIKSVKILTRMEELFKQLQRYDEISGHSGFYVDRHKYGDYVEYEDIEDMINQLKKEFTK